MGKLSFILFLLLTLIQVSTSSAEDGDDNQVGTKWAVIVAGANTYSSYFSQANACHLYHTLRNGGIAAENIIHFNYDDIAHAEENPYQGNLINKVGGVNVYPGCLIDYRAKTVSPEVFLNVITGNKTAVKKLTGETGKVLESGPNDHVLMALTDHGSPGIFYFPTDRLHAMDFFQALTKMHQRQMYSKMVIQLESCESGSMFEGILPDNMNIYAVTATNPHELGWMCCYDESRQVYVGTEFFDAFTYTTDKVNRTKETFLELYEVEKKKCNGSVGVSHPQQYGNKTYNQLHLSEFLGNVNTFQHTSTGLSVTMEKEISKSTLKEDASMPPFLKNPPIDMVSIATLMRRLRSNDLMESKRLVYRKELNHLLKVKALAYKLVVDIVEKATENNDHFIWNAFLDNRQTIKDHECYREAITVLTSQCPVMDANKYSFVGRNFHTLINLCNDLDTDIVINAIKKTMNAANCYV